MVKFADDIHTTTQTCKQVLKTERFVDNYFAEFIKQTTRKGILVISNNVIHFKETTLTILQLRVLKYLQRKSLISGNCFQMLCQTMRHGFQQFYSEFSREISPLPSYPHGKFLFYLPVKFLHYFPVLPVPHIKPTKTTSGTTVASTTMSMRSTVITAGIARAE